MFFPIISKSSSLLRYDVNVHIKDIDWPTSDIPMIKTHTQTLQWTVDGSGLSGGLNAQIRIYVWGIRILSLTINGDLSVRRLGFKIDIIKDARNGSIKTADCQCGGGSVRLRLYGSIVAWIANMFTSLIESRTRKLLADPDGL
ncbi:uncharacterized protein LOC134259187, partial [Saccostrea cucullata]|uniref:uncharacterized protein LOC134259187 n=1 Tax=Saccostrea cuccullata TaxID=36930 RepID=UPI002ED0F044